MLEGDLLLSEAQVLAHGVNCLGVMGSGIALPIKRRNMQMFETYRHLCKTKQLVPGGYYLEKSSSPWILNLATQKDLTGAKIEYIKQAFELIARDYEKEGMQSIAMPTIGCGLGRLKWNEVKSLFFDILEPLPIPIYVYENFISDLKANEPR